VTAPGIAVLVLAAIVVAAWGGHRAGRRRSDRLLARARTKRARRGRYRRQARHTAMITTVTAIVIILVLLSRR
jgi:hypothetical protein